MRGVMTFAELREIMMSAALKSASVRGLASDSPPKSLRSIDDFDGTLSRWSVTKEEYYRLGELGFFSDKRVQLINGDVLVMAAQSNWHATVIKAVERALEHSFGTEYFVRVQNSLDLSPLSVPDPDLAVIAGSYDSHMDRENPTTAIMVVEVSETTLHEDRERKSGLYAASGIAEYWIANIRDQRLEVRTRPKVNSSNEFGFDYADLTMLDADEFVTPRALPGVKIPVRKLFPMLPPSD